VIGTEGVPVEALGVWAAPGGRAVVCVRPVGGVMVVQVRGRLDVALVQPVRAALDVATAGAGAVVVDLALVAPAAPAAVAFLGGLRRYVLARGCSVMFAAVPEPLLAAMRRAGVRAFYEVVETVADGVDRAGSGGGGAPPAGGVASGPGQGGAARGRDDVIPAQGEHMPVVRLIDPEITGYPRAEQEG